MKFKAKTGEKDWKKGIKAQKGDGYGLAIFRYAESWANLMEKRMACGKTLVECAEKASHDADVEGITGFMYGAAVSILSQTWEHGESLRQWHNLKTQVGNEGAKANKSGGVINPALITISTK